VGRDEPADGIVFGQGGQPLGDALKVSRFRLLDSCQDYLARFAVSG